MAIIIIETLTNFIAFASTSKWNFGHVFINLVLSITSISLANKRYESKDELPIKYNYLMYLVPLMPNAKKI